MKLAKKYAKSRAKVPFYIIVGDNMKSASEMPASVALEIMKRAEKLEFLDNNEVKAEEMVFPVNAFLFEEYDGVDLSSITKD